MGLIATATRVGTAFDAFGLVLLPTLAFIGLVTFERVLQSGLEDRGFARRIALLRNYYFDHAPELSSYLLSVPEREELRLLGLSSVRAQAYRTVAAMVGVITAVLAGSAAGLLTAIASDHSLVGALVAGGAVTIAVLSGLLRYQRSAWARAAATPLTLDPRAETPATEQNVR